MAYVYGRVSHDHQEMLKGLNLKSERGASIAPSDWVVDPDTGSFLLLAQRGMADERERFDMYFSHKGNIAYLRLQSDSEEGADGSIARWWNIRDAISMLGADVISDEWVAALKSALVAETKKYNTNISATFDI